MKTSRQLTDLVKNKAENLGISAQILLRRYFMEKFLERISKSEYNKNFVLKGGVLVSALVGLNVRTTQDIDLSIMNMPLTTENIVKVLTEIAGIPNDDGIVFAFEKIQNIMEGLDYPGVRVFFTVQMDKIREKIHLDISTGDKIIPREIVFGYKLLLDDRTIDICAYTVETVLAEKIETILSRNVTNTRARDYYDCYILEKIFFDKIDYSNLALAIKSTAEKRNSVAALMQAKEILLTIYSDDGQKKQWERYQKDNPAEEIIPFTKTVESIQRLIEKASNPKVRDSGSKTDNRLYLKIPTIDELDYRIKLLADPDTMEYNRGYGDDDTGCYYLTKEKAEKWYNYWISDPKRYYAYIMKKDGDIPIGDVNIHFDKDYNLNMIGIVIEAKHRGKGYSEEALRLLADVAFYQLGHGAIFDCLPHDRPIAEKAFIRVGFTWTDNDILLLTKERYETVTGIKCC